MLEFLEVKASDGWVAEQIIRLERMVFGSGAVDAWSLPPLIRHGRVFVIEEDGHVLAVVEYMRDFDDGQAVYLYGLAVQPNARRQGLAQKLLCNSFRCLARKGFSRVYLTVAPDNEAALRLYVDAFGFNRVAYYPHEYGKGVHRYLLSYSLKEEMDG